MKIFLSDFDGTLVNKDVLDVICGINGKEDESRRLNEEFIEGKREGLPTLKQRIDFLNGITIDQISEKLRVEDFLIPGAKELFAYLRRKGVTTVLHSGNLIPVLQYYQQELGIDYIVGNMPRMDNNVVLGIELSDFAGREFKVIGCKKIIDRLALGKEDIIAIGDSPADKAVFELADTRIVINAKGGIEQEATIILKDDLLELPSILDKIV